MDEELVAWWSNYYECTCGYDWTHEWSCACDDRCPSCNTSCSPVESEQIGEDEDEDNCNS